MLSPTKRTRVQEDLSHPKKKRALQERHNQLLTPESSPAKHSVIDIAEHIKGHGRKLNFGQASIYSKAKSLFQRGAKNGDSSALVGRESEAAVLNKFLETSLKGKICNSIYISGPPGTGKTAQTDLSLDYLCRGGAGATAAATHDIFGTQTRVLRVNCMTVPKPDDIFHEIHVALNGKSTACRKRNFDDLYGSLAAGSAAEALVVVLDEMDCLITKDQQVLFQLFHCASHMKSAVLKTKLVVIGISNALDLTDKFLPRLRSNGFNPASLQFLPYSADQIRQVVAAKLQTLHGDEHDKENAAPAPPLMHPSAVLMCSKKCAMVAGDLRKAFDICYRSIGLVEQQAKQRADFASLTLENAPKVMISHVAKVCVSAFTSSSSQKLNALNLLQKAVLCCLLNSEKNSTTKQASTVNELYDFYCKHTLLVVEDLLGKIKKGEFLELVGALESASAITFAAAGSKTVDCGSKKIHSNVTFAEMQKACEDVGVLRKILLE